tara:strand:- start:877 stop:981 length:105 start_codon:yes stop_codon:yes gene_type:complete
VVAVEEDIELVAVEQEGIELQALALVLYEDPLSL